jgi:alkanesulfonate monooxygenase SsuD/methylene tetrahydromethanopterin reductase-like flavin-dependent oxidoreductase (luciferase family)
VNRPRILRRAERRERERGSITAVVVVFAAAFLVLGGLVYDAGRAMAAKTTAIDEAQQAARTAAQALNAGELRNNVLATTPGQAIADAEAYIAASGDTGTVTITGQTITVHVVRRQSTSLLALVGVGEITVSGTASSQLEQGVTSSESGQGR